MRFERGAGGHLLSQYNVACLGCHVVIYDKKYMYLIFVLVFGTEPPNSLEFLKCF